VGLRERAKQEKLARIVDAARKLFTEQGYEATTTAAIAEAAGVGAGTLFLYAASKEDLLVLVFRGELGRIWDDAFATLRDDEPLLVQLTALFDQVVAVHERDPALARAFLKELLFVSDAERAGVSEFMNGLMDRLAGLVRRAQARGELDPDLPPRALATNLFAVYFHLMQCRYGGYLDPAELPGRLHSAVELQLRGLGEPHRRG
jgi:AcrR family transcriptional regulator